MWARPRDEAVGEVGFHRQGLADSEFRHHHEAQAVCEAIDLVTRALEEIEGLALLVRCCPVNACELLPVSPFGLARTSGHIGFLGHGSIVEFRNIRIKELR